jgi:hypothetical protein
LRRGAEKHFTENDPRPCCTLQASEICTQQAYADRHPPRAVKVFDVLYVKTQGGDPKCLLDVPLWMRKDFLSQVFTPQQGIMEIATVEKVSTVAHIADLLKRLLEERCIDDECFA